MLKLLIASLFFAAFAEGQFTTSPPRNFTLFRTTSRTNRTTGSRNFNTTFNPRSTFRPTGKTTFNPNATFPFTTSRTFRPTGRTSIRTTTSFGTTAGPKPSIFKCNFESNTCFPRSSFGFIRNRGATPLTGTGPSSGSDGKGYYIYFNSQRYSSANFRYRLPGTFKQGTNICLNFSYHMFGNGIGSLTVNYQEIFSQRSISLNVWKRSGDQGNQWRRAAINLSVRNEIPTFVEISFFVDRRNSFGNIALDDIVLFDECRIPDTEPTPPRTVLLPFGTSVGDRKSFSTVSCTNVHQDFPLFTTANHRQLCINRNGFITVDQYDSSSRISFPRPYSVLAPYNLQLTLTSFSSTSKEGIFFRLTSDQSILSAIDADIRRSGNTSSPFRSRMAFIVTYNNVRARFQSNNFFKFQAIIATDWTKTYAIANYERLDSDASLVGYHEALCGDTVQQSFNTRQLAFTSNVGIAGKHVYRLSGEEDECFNRDVMYPFGISKGDVRRVFSRYNSRPFRVNLRLPEDFQFFSRQIRDDESLWINPRGFLFIGRNSYFSPFSRSTYVAPYYYVERLNGNTDIFFRQTTNQTILDQAARDINNMNNTGNGTNTRGDFTPTSVFVVTYQSGQLKFQIALATDGLDTYAIMNYEELSLNANTVGMNEFGCAFRSFANRFNSANTLLKGSNTGVRGRHVFYLTTRGCFREVSGMRTRSTRTRSSYFSSASFSSYSETLTVLAPNEIGEIETYVAEATANIESPFIMSTQLSSSFQRNPYSFNSGYIFFLSTTKKQRFVRYSFQNLFVLTETPKSPTLQYGDSDVPTVGLKTVCSRIYFDSDMESCPIVKITSHLKSTSIENHVSIWLREVSKSGFKFCAKKLVSFSVSTNFNVSYVAVVNTPLNISESQKIKSVRADEAKPCMKQRFEKIYLTPPSVFVTAEELSNGTEAVVTWVKRVSTTDVEVCLQSPREDELFDVHMIVSGQVSPCTYFQCPDHLQCRLDYRQRPVCDCIRDCSLKEVNPVEFCGTDFNTYRSICHLNQVHCLRFGSNTTTSVTIEHYGKCQLQPFQAGHTELNPVPEMPGVFCNYIKLDHTNFLPDLSNSSLKVFLSVAWRSSNVASNNEAAASWSEDVTIHGFRACVLVAGRHLSSYFTTRPIVHWTALQKEFFRDKGKKDIQTGSVELATWYTGSQCMVINPPNRFFFRPPHSSVIVSVQHVRPKSFSNAMTAWVEHDFRTTRVCARELQNFDGKHEGVVLHWLMQTSTDNTPLPPQIPENVNVMFPSRSSNFKANPIECKSVPFNLKFPSLLNPTVLVGAYQIGSRFGFGSTTFSRSDNVVWIQNIKPAEVTVCLKSVDSDVGRPEVNVNILVVASICGDDSTYYRGSCYKRLPRCASWTSAKQQCQASSGGGGSESDLPVIQSAEELIFLQEKISSSSWINLHRSPANTGPWVWADGSMVTYTKWYPGQPANVRSHNCAIMDRRGPDVGWREEHCETCKSIICEQDPNLLERTCSHYCINGGTCIPPSISNSDVNNSTNVSCVCPEGFAGERCHINLSEINACFNYTEITDSWRNINATNSTEFNNTSGCGHQNFTLGGWVRFTGDAGTKILDRCPRGTNMCGVRNPGWLRPVNVPVGRMVKSSVFFRQGFFCYSRSSTVEITNCGDFYTYRYRFPLYLNQCDYGLCTV